MNRFLQNISIRKVVIVAIGISAFFFLINVMFSPSKHRTKLDLKPEMVSVSVQKVSNQAQYLSFEYYGVLRNGFIPLVTAGVSGKYHEFQKLSVGNKIKKNQRLGNIENPELSVDLNNKKQSLTNLLNSIEASISLDFPQYVDAWSKYTQHLIDKQDYSFPTFGNDQFQHFIENQGLRNQLYAVQKAKESVSDQLIVATVEGTVAKVHTQNDEYVSKGKVIYELSSSKGHEIEISLRKEHIPFLNKKTAYTFIADNKEYTGFYTGSSPKINTSNYTISCTFRLTNTQALMAGEYLTLSLKVPICENCSKISSNAVYESASVYVLADSIITAKKINVISSDLDYTYYTGLTNQELVLDKFTNSQYLGKKAEVR